MKQREALHMDYQKHVEYLPSTKAVLTRRLCERFGAEQGRRESVEEFTRTGSAKDCRWF